MNRRKAGEISKSNNVSRENFIEYRIFTKKKWRESRTAKINGSFSDASFFLCMYRINLRQFFGEKNFSEINRSKKISGVYVQHFSKWKKNDWRYCQHFLLALSLFVGEKGPRGFEPATENCDNTTRKTFLVFENNTFFTDSQAKKRSWNE